jgi:hypothetical protein
MGVGDSGGEDCCHIKGKRESSDTSLEWGERALEKYNNGTKMNDNIQWRCLQQRL